MVRKLRMIASVGAFAAVVLLGPTQARAQFGFRGGGYFGGGSYLGGGYSFERFSAYSWGNPLLAYGYGFGYGMPYGYGYGYGVPYGYGYGYGVPYGYGYGYEFPPIPYPYPPLASYPFFSYVTSDQNSPTPKTIEPGKYIRPPAESVPSDNSRSGLVPSLQQRRTRDTRRSIVYRADAPRQEDVKQPPQTQTQTQTQAGRLIVTRTTAP